jgi:hypothetical protein
MVAYWSLIGRLLVVYWWFIGGLIVVWYFLHGLIRDDHRDIDGLTLRIAGVGGNLPTILRESTNVMGDRIKKTWEPSRNFVVLIYLDCIQIYIMNHHCSHCPYIPSLFQSKIPGSSYQYGCFVLNCCSYIKLSPNRWRWTQHSDSQEVQYLEYDLGWLVVLTILKNTSQWVNGMIIPNIWEKNKCSKPPNMI